MEDASFNFSKWREEFHNQNGITENTNPYIALVKIAESQKKLCKTNGKDYEKYDELIKMYEETYQQSLLEHQNPETR